MSTYAEVQRLEEEVRYLSDKVEELEAALAALAAWRALDKDMATGLPKHDYVESLREENDRLYKTIAALQNRTY